MRRKLVQNSTPLPEHKVSAFKLPQTPMNVLLDSGAYTAWRSGITIDLKAYCRFIKDNADWVTNYAVLDVIGPNDPEEAARASMANYKFMRKEGLHPLPIFHVGENIRWLREMLDLGATYVGLSASSIVSRGGVDPWYNLMWENLCTSDGLPIIKTHAFGEGRTASLMRGPWQSADTATWIYAASRAGIVRIGNKRLSHRNDKVSFRHAQEVTTLDDVNLRSWTEHMEQAGLQHDTFDRMQAAKREATDGEVVRLYLAAKHYLALQQQVRAAQPIKYFPHSFAALDNNTAQSVNVAPFCMHLVIGSNPKAAACSILAGSENCLISYAYLLSTKKAPSMVAKVRKLVLRDPTAWEDQSYNRDRKILESYAL